MTDQFPGQLSLFDGPFTFRLSDRDLVAYETWQDRLTTEQEVCDECGTVCTSSKECVEASGLYDD